MGARHIFSSWLRTRWAMRKSAKKLEVSRKALWAALQPALARTPALARYAGQPLGDFPITEIADLRGDYGSWNSLGMSGDDLRALADEAEAGEAGQAGQASGKISAGWSTGSGGRTRGLFATSETERADYIGQSLARLLPNRALLHRQRMALHLRASNTLYSDIKRGRFDFAHFPLKAPLTETLKSLQAFAPTILIAPPHRLIAFAKAGLRLPSLRYLFCGSEPISEAECEFVSNSFGLFPYAIYQATEGFLGGECREGCLHLNDHSLEIELERVPGTSGFRPIITDLRRNSLPIVRLRGDDYLEVRNVQCRCGFGGRVIHPVQGRVSDIWQFERRCITPPQVVATAEDVLGGVHAWQAEASPGSVTLRVSPEHHEDAALRAMFSLQQLAGYPVSLRRDFALWNGPKRRKVVWNYG